ncbi:lim and transglutaminase domain protein ltd-1-like [Saccostrea cucullata]|uniref:lim and transglutaminase domain protein ltd-1-like n=1 Tax=Saccostrea cuccullata TaxID=36930 RepID=UPI002ED44BE3
MGCGGSTSTKTNDGRESHEKPKGKGVDSKPKEKEEDYLREPENDSVDLEDIIVGYPPPKPSSNRKEHIFTELDKNTADSRANQIKVEDYQTLEDIARALTEGLKNDVQKVRAIFTWIGSQGSRGDKSSQKDKSQSQDATSPQTIVQQVIQRKLSFNFLFISLCRAAKIPCVLIRGLGKSISYEVGDKDVDSLNNSWTAVHVAGGWRFVFPLWAFSAVVGHSKGTWTLVETQGKGAREKEEKSSGQTISHINDYFFLTEADEFIYTCYPNDSKWQLLTRPFTKQDFIEIAYCRQGYFQNHYKITTPTKCIYSSVGGVCDIGIKKLVKEECSYAYKLFFNHEESKTTLSSEIQLERYVAIFNEGPAMRFRVRFPSEGIYKMQIFGDGSRLCEFRLECNEDVNDVKPFPCNPESGFGPNSLTEEAGLKAQSHKTGFINIKQTKNVNMKFNITKNVLVQTILIHNNMEQETLNKHVNHKIKGQELDINVNLPEKGEYALQINTKDKDSDGPFKNVCNYLLTSENMNKKRKPYENAIEKRTRKALQDNTSSNDIKALKKALDDFDKIDMEDKGDRQKAEERLTYLSLRKELKDAIARRHGDKLEEAIENAKSSQYESDLQKLIKEAEDLLSQLRRLKRFAHEVLKMQQPTISEIHNYKHPKPMAYDVMKATYILLGEEEKRVEEWEQIQALMRKTGKEGLLRRVRLFDTVNVTENMVNHSSQILRPYDEERIQASSAGLGTFYKWVTDVIEEIRKSENSPRD